MPIPQLRRRVYGYIEPENKNEQPEKKKQRPLRHNLIVRFFLALIFSPFRLIGSILLAFVRLWKKIPKKTKRGATKTILSFIFVIVILGFIGLTTLIAWVSRDLPDPDRLTDRHVAQSTKIYDRSGEHLLYEIFTSEKRTLVDLDEIPETVIHAVIATEDKKFFEHRGVRPLSIARSLFYGVLGRGRVGGGASTLTQQLVKNAILTNERTLTRKLKEIILSVRLEQKYTKEQILKIYFNEIPYGSTNYGIEAAAQSYFGKSISDVNLGEAATLAGLPKAPSYYLNNPETLKQRRDFVLDQMVEDGYITSATATEAKNTPLTLTHRVTNIHAPHFVFYVKDLLEREFGQKTVETGGLRVITTLDWEKQQIAEEAVSSSQKILKEADADNTALVAIDPKNGHILAMVGSKNFFDPTIKGQFNVATQGLRQPGSSFKPIIYAAAFEKGLTPDTILFDVLTNFAVPGAKEYRPVNYDGKEHGPVTIRTALQGSLNIPAVQTLYLVGPDEGVAFAERLGYTTLSEGDFGLTLVLGGGEVKLIEHTSAYATFANNGIRHTPEAILRVEDSRGDILKEWISEPGEKVLDPSITATLSNVLADDEARAFMFGHGGILTLKDRPVAAKTGTTNNYVDGWTMGYTPNLAAGVWVGNTDNRPLKPGFGGSKVAGTIWNQFMRSVLDGSPTEQFPTPPINNAQKPILRGSVGGSVTVRINRVSGKIATSSTPDEFISVRTFTPAHSILHYIDKNDPPGHPPTQPETDPQYPIWEAAIQEWISRNKANNPEWVISFEDPPKEFDTTESPPLLPSLEILSPTPETTFFTQITSQVEASAPRGIAQVIFLIDGQIVTTLSEPPFSLVYTPTTPLSKGAHTLTVFAEDDIGNRQRKDIPIFVEDITAE